MSEWLDDLLMLGTEDSGSGNDYEQTVEHACVLVTVASTRGSTPRDAGTRMVVTPDTSCGTIGGGHLELQAISIARHLLTTASSGCHVERFALGARAGQCCGGVVHLSFECVPHARPAWLAQLKTIRDAGQVAIMVSSVDTQVADSSKLIVTADSCFGTLADSRQHQKAYSRALEMLDEVSSLPVLQEESLLYERVGKPQLQIALFGAGHVGKALVSMLSRLPCHIIWIDSRASEFPERIASNVCIELADQPELEVDDLPAGSHVVIMTHSHALDQAVCERALRRDDLAWCGLIGSITKRRQFEKRLLARGLPESCLEKLACPIGIDGISSKHPAVIAIAVAAQILLVAQSRQNNNLLDDRAA